MLRGLFLAVLSSLGLVAGLYAIEPETAQISERLQKFVEATNQGRVDALSSFWTDDAEFIVPATGVAIDGKKAIMEYLQKLNAEVQERHLHFKFTQGKMKFSDANDAIVEGIIEVTDKGNLLQRNARRIELVRKNGEWYINSVREIEVPPPPPFYQYLKEVEWLIGNWKDIDENVTNTYLTKWDKFKNHIFQHFTMEVYGVVGLEGLQIIGWDPVEKKIRSWVYDSDGGFGTGLWSKKDDAWQVTMQYVLTNGEKASATNIYKKINDNSYSYSSIDRKIGDQVLPNIEPVTVVKEGK